MTGGFYEDYELNESEAPVMYSLRIDRKAIIKKDGNEEYAIKFTKDLRRAALLVDKQKILIYNMIDDSND